jgi:hypothetical protein
VAIKRVDHLYQYHKVGDHQIVFEIANEDLAGDPQYFGYLTETGAWMIQKRTIATGIYLYAIGASAYTTAWTGRAALSYVAFSSL